ncbi:3-oxoacyl-ACP synthase III family protein [Streptomyces sp. NRRL B-1347]|uniref:3-oxoacyl-ACP synthase III family protein n=1 Tax=Streptomyces sp. NRRL B-1347 TaxID=1476877 RepID=UPI0004C5844C|nr:ketoacyl-ACP synthase III [Streptomyces sp. NRRL B-1347]
MEAHSGQDIGILSTGAYVPDQAITNSMVAQGASVEESWILRATGIHERRRAEPHQRTSEMAEPAAKEALACVQGNVDAVIVATSSPDQPAPATASSLQYRLGITDRPAFDINAVCGGFVYGMAVARSLILTHDDISTVLLVGADQLSKFTDPTDRSTAPLFGDGAGAVVLGPVSEPSGIKAVRLTAFSEHHDLVGITTPTPQHADCRARAGTIHLNGRRVRDVFLDKLPLLVRQATHDAGWTVPEVDWFVFHQGNPAMLRDTATRLNISPERIGITADLYGNTGCASMPLTLYHMNRAAPFERGQRIILAGAGAGITVGALALLW